jgi:hypothetical protein
MFNPMMMMKGFGKTGLRNFQNDRKVFVGGMPPNNTSKEINMKLKEIPKGAGWLRDVESDWYM